MKLFCHVNGKERFSTRASALKASRSMEAKNKGTPSVYLCPHCQSYHLTHYSYEESKFLREYVLTPIEKCKTKKDKDMKIFIDTAYDSCGVCIEVKNTQDNDQLLSVTCFDGDGNQVQQLFTYQQAIEMDEAIKIQLAKMTPRQ